MESPFANQISSDSVLSARISDRWRYAVVLERLARSGGSVKWYFSSSENSLRRIFSSLSEGSLVTIYFDCHLHVEPDDDGARGRMYELLTARGELIVGYPDHHAPDFTMEIISGPSELTDFLMRHPEGCLAVWGEWPPPSNDGVDAVTIQLVDEDGVQLQHPH